MDYKELLNNIYTQFKSNDKYKLNENIKFFKENNTNIVNFEVNDINIGIINGTIVEQSNSVLIYFYIENEFSEYIFISKANINMGNVAIITNLLLNKGDFEMIETIRRNFERREDLYKSSLGDEFITNGELDSEFTDLVSMVVDNYNTGKYIKKK